MDVEVFHTASRPARAVQLRAALSDVSVDLAAATTDVLNASSAAQLKHSAAIDASLQLLDMLDVTPSEAIHGIRDHLRDHVRGVYSVYAWRWRASSAPPVHAYGLVVVHPPFPPVQSLCRARAVPPSARAG